MANPYFEFKEFTIHQDKCAMKVGTDGVLLGAWAKANSPKQILDVGTGTGLVALMLAQRFKNTLIDAIEIDQLAANQAGENVRKSRWGDRIMVYNESFQTFIGTVRVKYDLVVSNPPFFSNGKESLNPQRAIARHNTQLSLKELVAGAISVLDSDGEICLILPIEQRRDLVSISSKCGLWIKSELKIRPTPNLPVNRFIVVLTKKIPDKKKKEEITIETKGRHLYSEQFKKLTGEYYLF